MNKYFKSLFLIVISSLLILLTGCNSEGAFSVSADSESALELERIDIVASPITTKGVSALTLTAGNQQPFEAVGYYSDGSSHPLTDLNVNDWHTSDKEVGYFNVPGVLIGGDRPEIVTVHASKGGISSNKVNINVTAAIITSIQVTPSPVNLAKGQTQQLVATAIYSDGLSSDVSSSASWAPFDTTYAMVTSAGLLSGTEVGSTTLTATKDGITSNTVDVNVSAADITAIQVTPSPVNVAKGQRWQLEARATYSDGSSSDVSSSASWASVDTATATVTPAGLLSGVDVGSTTLTASKDGVTSNTVSVEISAAFITAISVTPPSVSVVEGQRRQLLATATYSDGNSSDVSDSVTWTSDEPQTVTVTPTGVLAGNAVANTTVTAFKDGVTSNTVDVEVTNAAITSITVTPSAVSVVAGLKQQLLAAATYSDGTSSDVSDSVTWTSDDLSTATVTPTGFMSGVNVGQTTITATKDGVTSNTVSVEVSACTNTSFCLDIFDTGNGKLFTNSPSTLFLSSIGGSVNNGVTQEIGTSGPAGDFLWFTWENASRLCAAYNNRNLAGRTNWRLATKNELEGLFNTYGNMFNARGWPVRLNYWSSMTVGPGFFNVSLKNGGGGPSLGEEELYASCVSVP